MAALVPGLAFGLDILEPGGAGPVQIGKGRIGARIENFRVQQDCNSTTTTRGDILVKLGKLRLATERPSPEAGLNFKSHRTAWSVARFTGPMDS